MESANDLAGCITHFEKLCEDLQKKARHGNLTLAAVHEFKSDLTRFAGKTGTKPYILGLLNQAIARVDSLEYQLSVAAPGVVTPGVVATAKTLCDTLGSLKVEVAAAA